MTIPTKVTIEGWHIGSLEITLAIEKNSGDTWTNTELKSLQDLVSVTVTSITNMELHSVFHMKQVEYEKCDMFYRIRLVTYNAVVGEKIQENAV